jgi:hypothetical protein
MIPAPTATTTPSGSPSARRTIVGNNECRWDRAASMSDDYSMTVDDDWSAWPEDLDPAEAADQLTPLRPDDPRESLIQLLRAVPTVIGTAPTPISDGSRMAEDRDSAQDLLNVPMLCHN